VKKEVQIGKSQEFMPSWSIIYSNCGGVAENDEVRKSKHRTDHK